MTTTEAYKINRIRGYAAFLAELAEQAIGGLVGYIEDNDRALCDFFDSGVGLHEIELAEKNMKLLKESYQKRVVADEE